MLRLSGGSHTWGVLSTLLTRLVTQIQRHKAAHTHKHTHWRTHTQPEPGNGKRKQNISPNASVASDRQLGCECRQAWGQTYLANKHWLICWQYTHTGKHTHTHTRTHRQANTRRVYQFECLLFDYWIMATRCACRIPNKATGAQHTQSTHTHRERGRVGERETDPAAHRGQSRGPVACPVACRAPINFNKC